MVKNITKKQGNALDKRIVYSVSSPQIKNSLIGKPYLYIF